MKEIVGDERLIIIGVAVRGINDHIRFYKCELALFRKPCTRQAARIPPTRTGTFGGT